MVSQGSSSSSPFPKFTNLLVTSPSPGVCHCQLARSPVNALNTALWTELLTLLNHLEQRHFPNKTKVLVISSAARGNIFSAGNDLTELHMPSTNYTRFINFWTTSTIFLARLYKSPLYTIAAVRGATPAGGCVMSLCCDYRIALSDTSLGLNEVAIGLAVPPFWARLLLKTSSSRSRGEKMLASGEMVSAREAQRIGLIDETVTGDRHTLVDAALRHAGEWARRRGVSGRARTKSSVRAEFANQWEAYAPEEAEKAWADLSDKQTIAELGHIMKRLSQRNAKM